MALLSAITARPLSPPVFALYRNGCREHLAAPQNVSFVQPSGLEASSRDCATRVTRREREFAAQTAQAMAEDRPWKFEIPTMDEILESPRWPEKVKNWTTFWSLFLNWVQGWGNLVLLERGEEEEMSMPKESLAWLQLFLEDKQKIEDVIDTVVAQVPTLQQQGYPVPETIPGKKPWHIGHWKISHFTDHIGRTQWEKDEIVGLKPLWTTPKDVKYQDSFAATAPVGATWDSWGPWELRAHMEKRRRHYRRQAAFAARQAQIGRHDHLTVSHMTDARMAVDPPFYPMRRRDHSHEEIMEVVCGHGLAVDPEQVAITIGDPLEPADAFEDGVHWVPDTLDFIRSVGHLTETVEDLVGSRDASIPSATMEEEFADTEEEDPLSAGGFGTAGEGEEDGFDVDEEDGFGPVELDDDVD